jgi:hypothetical protein
MPDLTITQIEDGKPLYSYTLGIQGDDIEKVNPYTLNGSSDTEFFNYGFKIRGDGNSITSDPEHTSTVGLITSLMFLNCQIDGLPEDWQKAIEIHQFCAEHDIDIDEYEDYIAAGEPDPNAVELPDYRVY